MRLQTYRDTFLFVLAFFCVCAASGFAADLSANEKLQFANGLYARGIYDLASEEYSTFAAKHPGHKSIDIARFRLGECYRRTAQADKAIEQFLQVFEDFPKSGFRLRAGLLAGDLALQEGKTKTAISILENVIKSDPPRHIAASALYSLGEALRSTERLEKAEKRFEDLINKHKDSDLYPYGLLALGRVYSELGKDKKAVGMFTRAEKSSDNDDMKAESIFRIAEHHFRHNRFKQSSEAYQELLEAYPEHSRSDEAGLRAAWAMHNAGDYKRSLKYADKNINRLSKSGRTPSGPLAEWIYIRANCLRQLNEHEKSLREYETLLERFPGSRFTNAASYEAALVSYRSENYKRALELAGRVDVDQLPGLAPNVYWLMAETYSGSGREDEAERYYKLVVSRYPGSNLACEAAYRLGHRLHRNGECGKAAEYYRVIVNDFPSHELAPKSMFSLGVCFAKMGRLEDAVKKWSEFGEKHAGHPLLEEAMYRQAVALVKLDRNDKALVALTGLLEKFPGGERSGVARYWRGIIHQQEGQEKEAEQDLKFALKHGLHGSRKLEARFRLAALLKNKQEFEEAADIFQSLLATEMRREFAPGMLQWLAEYRYNRQNYAESVEAARALVASSQDAGWEQTGWTLIGRCMLKQGSRQAAASAFKRALAKKAGTRFKAEAALRLGDIELDAENYKQAREFYEQAATLASSDEMLGIRANAYAGIAGAWEGQGRLENSARYFMSVAILYDDPELAPRCLYRAYRNFMAMQKLDSAGKAAEDLRARYPNSEYAGKLPEPGE